MTMTIPCAVNLCRHYIDIEEKRLAHILKWLCNLLYDKKNMSFYLDICTAIYFLALSNLNTVLDEIDLVFLFGSFVPNLDAMAKRSKKTKTKVQDEEEEFLDTKKLKKFLIIF